MGKKLRPTVSEEHVKGIGEITINFALLETLVALCIGYLIDSKDQRPGQIVTAQLSFSRAVDLLGSLYVYRNSDPEAEGRLDDILRRARKAQDRRNQVIHSFWGRSESGEAIYRLKWTAKGIKGIRHQRERMSVEDFNDIAEFIAEVAYDIQDLVLRDFKP